MAEKYRLEQSAKNDIKESARFYEEHKEGLGGEFIDEVNLKILELSEKPDKYSLYYKNVRKAPLKKFPFNIIYIIGEALISVIGVWHRKRNPDFLKNRIDSD